MQHHKTDRIGQFIKQQRFRWRSTVARVLKQSPWTTIDRRDRYLPVRLSAIVGLGCSAIAAVLVSASERGRTAYNFDKQVEALALALQQEIDRYIEVPETLGTFYEAADRVTAENFSLISTSFLQRYPAIESVAWIDRVEKTERDLYERAIAEPRILAEPNRDRALDFPEKPFPFSIWELDDRGRAVPSPPRSEYFPISHIEPSAQYSSQLGYDGLSNRSFEISPHLRNAAVAIAFETDDEDQFRVVRGVYRSEPTGFGLVSIAYSRDRLVREAIRDVNLNHLNFEIFDLTAIAERQLLVTYDAERRTLTPPSENVRIADATCAVYPNCTRSLRVVPQAFDGGHNREWLLVVRPQPEYRSQSRKVEATFAVGLALTTLVTAYLWMSIRRTVQLEDAKQALERSRGEIYERAQWERSIGRVASQIRNFLDIDTILDTVVRELRTLLNVERCRFCWYRGGETPHWEVVAESHHVLAASDLGQSYSVGEMGLTPETVRQLKRSRPSHLRTMSEEVYRSLVRCDLASESETDRAEPSENAVSCLTLPIQTQQGELGVLVLVDRQTRDWLDVEIESIETVGTQLAIALNQGELYQQTRTKAMELARMLEKLQSTQSQLVQTEKMSSLGQLVAGIAHEINNPVNFISGNLSHVEGYAESLSELLQRYRDLYPDPPRSLQEYADEIDLAFLMEDFPKILTSMRVGTTRIQEIVRSMRTFSRADEADMKAVDLHAGIESTLTILQSRLKATADRPAIAIVKNYGRLPDRVTCYAGLLDQVFMNVLSNGIDALETEYNGERPTIWISTEIEDEARVIVRIRDNGPGIPPQTRDRLFDPFFTTKPVGRGTGLGLSISYQIVVDKHGGELLCNSQLGEGTEFVIVIPLR
ncbi:Circadian input kinase A [Geitlerinema sp. FC II]|nr:Circadian input kinase A [Geitlerinema sp. FC II]